MGVCKRGHTGSGRDSTNGGCIECHKLLKKKYYKNNHPDMKIIHWISGIDPITFKKGTCSVCGPIDLTHLGSCANQNRQRQRERYSIDSSIHKNQRSLSTWGMTLEEKLEILKSQDNKCSICKTTDPGGRGDWHLDHNHLFSEKDKRGQRGLLCLKCNTGIGFFQEDIVILKSAIEYLLKWSKNV